MQASTCGEVVFPPRLRPGDRVAIVAPSGALPRGRFLSGVAWLRERYRVELSAEVFARKGYFAGDDAERLASLSARMRDPGIRAIIAGRGGYGATRIVSSLPWGEWAKAPSWLVGFSDVTALHLEAHARGVASLHAPNVTGLGGARACDRLRLMRALEGRLLAPWESLTSVRTGDATGRLVGGNLALIYAQAASGKLTNCNGAILVLEDVTEKPYQVDRMLHALLEAGMFACSAGIVFGEFAHCEAGPDGVTVSEVIGDFATRVSCPVYSGAPFGHGERNEPLILGSVANIVNGTMYFPRA